MTNVSLPATLDIEKIRREFPILSVRAHGKPLVYLDNAATSQKPKRVIEALVQYYEEYNANVHRGVHALAEKATQAYEETRIAAQKFIGAERPEEIIFTRGVTEGINLVASSYGKTFIQEGDEIILSGLEHHSNIVPWQLLCEEKKAHLKIIDINDKGEIELESFKKLLTDRTRIVSVSHASNTLGTINPIKEIIAQAHQTGAVVLIDGAQSGAHLPINVQDIDADFYCLSSHKMYGPTGIGIVYGKTRWLEKMPPYMGGGEMIKDVSFEHTTYNDLPYKFEAGTPSIAGTVAFREALAFINELDKERIRQHENELLAYASSKIGALPGVVLIGTASDKVSVLSFIVKGIHHFDIGQLLDTYGIAVRTGHHCTQPLMKRFNIEGTVRASFAAYNTKEEIDQLVEGLEKIIKIMS